MTTTKQTLTPLGEFTLTSIPGAWINVRTRPATGATDLGDLHVGDVCTLYAPDALGWVYVTTPTLEGWVFRQNGAVVFTPVVGFLLHPPFADYRIVSRFDDPRDYSVIAPNKLQKHEGTDFVPASDSCDPVVHVGAAGRVVKVDVDPPGYGNFVIIDHADHFETVYAHFAEIYVRVGQVLADRQIIGLMGSTGNSSEPHVHVTLSNPTIGASGYVYPSVVDPEHYLTILTA